MKKALGRTEISDSDYRGTRLIYSENRTGTAVAKHLGLMILILKLIRKYLDDKTRQLEITDDRETFDSWNVVMQCFPGTIYLGKELGNRVAEGVNPPPAKGYKSSGRYHDNNS